MNKIIDFICPKCGYECYPYDTDEIDFSPNGTGHYYFYCYCKNCDKNFKQCYDLSMKLLKNGVDGKYVIILFYHLKKFMLEK